MSARAGGSTRLCTLLLLDGLTWTIGGVSVSGQDIVTEQIVVENSVVKMPFDTYTNVKFGMNTIGGVNNDEDWPLHARGGDVPYPRRSSREERTG